MKRQAIYGSVVLTLSLGVGAYLFRPNGIAFPGAWFFLCYSIVPGFTAYLPIFLARQRNPAVRSLALLASLAALYVIWHLQVHALTQFVAHSSDRLAGLLSNFAVASGRLLRVPFWLCLLFLATVSFVPRKQGRRQPTGTP